MTFFTDDETRCPHHITFSCQHRTELFTDYHLCDQFVSHLRNVRTKNLFRLYAYAVMPHHVHILIQPEARMATILSAIKRPFSYQALQYLRSTQPGIYNQLEISMGRKSNHRFWLKGGGYDHWLTKEDSLHEIATYIQNNPVRWGMVEKPEDYRWSSAQFWINNDPSFPMDPMM